MTMLMCIRMVFQRLSALSSVSFSISLAVIVSPYAIARLGSPSAFQKVIESEFLLWQLFKCTCFGRNSL
jgi:hypothetical protein